MNEDNKKLLDGVIKDRLEKALFEEGDDEEVNAAFKQAMEAVDREIELSKIEASREEQVKKQELAAKEARNTWILRGIELGVVAIVAPTIGYLFNRSFARDICNFEKDYTFTTSAGRSLSKLFNFKK